ncbi:hypothetical protein [Clostridium botulinum]|uniref:hypothetical protein n=1 Tax=Clostridium botulinum TaxID=1491 RepID=UPI001C9A9154|nr:hypothetical protein [Clostridium botulinum]MBY6916024.1 hypothetical protein [Clostridium botulinum]
MIFKAKCCYCDSEELKLIDITLGAGTNGERTEKKIKCFGCGEELCLDEIDIEEVK